MQFKSLFSPIWTQGTLAYQPQATLTPVTHVQISANKQQFGNDHCFILTWHGVTVRWKSFHCYPFAYVRIPSPTGPLLWSARALPPSDSASIPQQVPSAHNLSWDKQHTMFSRSHFSPYALAVLQRIATRWQDCNVLRLMSLWFFFFFLLF